MSRQLTKFQQIHSNTMRNKISKLVKEYLLEKGFKSYGGKGYYSCNYEVYGQDRNFGGAKLTITPEGARWNIETKDECNEVNKVYKYEGLELDCPEEMDRFLTGLFEKSEFSCVKAVK